jgi:nucleotide-binding universal stress UspA family protein
VRQFDAHHFFIVLPALTGLSGFMSPATIMDAGMPPIAFPVEELRAAAKRTLDEFDRRARAMGVQSLEDRCLDDDVGAGLCLQARYADLVVISQMPPGEWAPYVQPDFPQYVALNSPRPVLVLPAVHAGGEIGRRVTVAWNGSAEAVHAIASALPLLRRAERVNFAGRP